MSPMDDRVVHVSNHGYSALKFKFPESYTVPNGGQIDGVDIG